MVPKSNTQYGIKLFFTKSSILEYELLQKYLPKPFQEPMYQLTKEHSVNLPTIEINKRLNKRPPLP